MKKQVISIIGSALLVCGANAANNYMRVATDDVKISYYDVEHVTEVEYVTDEVFADSMSHGVTVSGKLGDFTYVDLGLKSGLKWATYNVGATIPEEYGDYYAWGEIEEDTVYCLNTYKWCANGNRYSMIKYCTRSSYGTIDQMYRLLPVDDVATAEMGGVWRMPTVDEQDELRESCTWQWTVNFNNTGVAGSIGKSKKNGRIIFFPASGYYSFDDLKEEGTRALIWSSDLANGDQSSAFVLSGTQRTFDWGIESRACGLTVRGVAPKAEPKSTYFCVKTDDGMLDVFDVRHVSNVDFGEETIYAAMNISESGEVDNYKYVDLGLESGTLWATCNIGAASPLESGDYFAWGETQPKENKNYDKASYKWLDSEKYDGLEGHQSLAAEDDAATANWGKSWAMPTYEQAWELLVGCSWKWTENYKGTGFKGYIGTSKTNDNNIFIPAAGYYKDSELYENGSMGSFWVNKKNYGHTSYIYFLIDDNFSGSSDANVGRSVRAVVKQ